jgi:hypothetical protein
MNYSLPVDLRKHSSADKLIETIYQELGDYTSKHREACDSRISLKTYAAICKYREIRDNGVLAYTKPVRTIDSIAPIKE